MLIPFAAWLSTPVLRSACLAAVAFLVLPSSGHRLNRLGRPAGPGAPAHLGASARSPDDVAARPVASAARSPVRVWRRGMSARQAVTGAAGVCGLLAAATTSVLAAALVTVLVGALGWCGGREKAARRRALHAGELERCVRAVVEECRAGAPLGVALAAVAPDAPHYGPALAQAASDCRGSGQSPEVWARLAARQPDLIPLAVVGHLATRSGISLIGALEALAADLQEAQELRRRLSAAVAGPYGSVLLLGCLPAVGLAMGASLGAQPTRVLGGTAIGQASLVFGVAFEVVGVVWASLLIDRARP